MTKDAGKKVFLMPGNLRVHHGKPIKAWLEENREKTGAFYLPGCNPEPNPDERLNAGLKREIGSKMPVRAKMKLKAAASNCMGELEQNPERVRSCFRATRVAYAVWYFISTGSIAPCLR